MLIVFAGLPGVGKSTIALAVARQQLASYVRVDTIEQAIRSASELDVGTAGYEVGYAVAEANLQIGRTVIADAVNPVESSRKGWREVACKAKCPLLEVEIICSDLAEHRRRIEHRRSDIPGLKLPDWDSVLERNYEPWTSPHLIVDTACLTANQAVELIGNAIEQSSSS